MNRNTLEVQFTDFKPALETSEAIEEAQRCINCYDAPCIKACPTGINIPQFINRIGNGHAKGAAKTILDSNILGLSCAQSCPVEVLCEGACVYHELNKKPIAIGKLQRFAVEYAYDNKIEFYKAGPATGKRVALIGAGPASLACAHELRKYGHEAIIYEKSDVVGGLNTTGIAPYKMKAQVSLREIEQVTRLGVRIEYGKELGRNIDLKTLVKDHDAVFLGMGLGPDSRLDIPGAALARVYGAVDFIAKIKTAAASELEWLKKVQSALVIGGGNTALDACRELKWLKIPQVIVSYRKDEKSMSGYEHEYKWARQEGVDFKFHTTPTAIAPENDRLVATLNHGNEKIDLVVDLVLFATGQSKLDKLLGGLTIDSKTGRTSDPKVFAGGDLANGGKEVVNAVAEGKRAALAIHEGFTHG